MLNVIRYKLPLFVAQHPLTTKAISNPTLSSQRDLWPSTIQIHSIRNVKDRISSARREYSVNQMDNNGYLFFSKEEATMHWSRVAKMYNTVRVFLSFKLPYDDRFSASTMFTYLSNYSFIEILFEEMELIIIYTLA